MKNKRVFTVIGLYEDNMQRYANTFEAISADAAELVATELARREEGCELLIAAVIEGDVKVVA